MSEHYFVDRPSGPHRPHEVRVAVDGRSYTLLSGRGVFSADRLDPGTAVLLRSVTDVAGGTLLDLGCGYGPIACVLAVRRPDAHVWAVDVNARARALTEANAARLGVDERVTVADPADVPPEVTFDEIWSNPPIRIGKPALHALLRTWLARLAPDGTAWLVVAKNLGSDSLARWLAEQGHDVARHTSVRGYRVLRVRRAPSGLPTPPPH